MRWDPMCRWFLLDDGAIVTEQSLVLHAAVTEDHRVVAARGMKLWEEAFTASRSR